MSDMLNVSDNLAATSAEVIGDGRAVNLTRSQLLIWTGQKLSPGLPLYNMVMAFRIKGALSITDFQTSFTRLVLESDAMRTVFCEEDGLPTQSVLNELDFTLEVIDFSSSENSEKLAEDWVNKRARQPLDISKSLFDSFLLRLSDTDWIRYYNQHHLMNDGWSVTLVFIRVSNYYRELVGDAADKLIPLPPYQDYRMFEASQLAKDSDNSASEYWQEKLRTSSGPLALYG